MLSVSEARGQRHLSDGIVCLRKTLFGVLDATGLHKSIWGHTDAFLECA